MVLMYILLKDIICSWILKYYNQAERRNKVLKFNSIILIIINWTYI